MAQTKSKTHTKYRTAAGEVVPSVTTVISQNLGWNTRALMAWSRKMGAEGQDPNKVRDAAADVGTLAHYHIMQHVKGEPLDDAYVSEFSVQDGQMALTCLQRYLEWASTVGLEPVSSELGLVDEVCKVGGTIDMLATIQGANALVDFKTSKGVYADHVVQVAAYRHMVMHERDVDIPAVYLVRLPKDGADFEVHRYGPAVLDDAYEVFAHLRAIHDLQGKVRA